MKHKVCVYAISYNEEKHVMRWYNSMKEADYIVVLDTGSTDNTVELLESLGVKVVVQKITPWRFDEARNASLSIVPDEYDICVCTDLDEVFNKGWKDLVISSFIEGTTRLRYTYNWSFDEYGKPSTTFLLNKIHKNKIYKWTHPVHEVLTPLDEEVEVINESIILNHYPDKTKSRSNYLPLLELSVKEDPEDDRNMHYLGREYMYYGKYKEAIETLKKHLSLDSAKWKDERSASMRFIGRCYKALKDEDNSIIWYKKAIEEAPYLREAYVELGYLYYEKEDYLASFKYLNEAFKIKDKSKSYINEEYAWNSFIYDLYSIVLFNLELYNESFIYAKHALELDPNNLRLQLNLEKIEKFIKK